MSWAAEQERLERRAEWQRKMGTRFGPIRRMYTWVRVHCKSPTFWFSHPLHLPAERVVPSSFEHCVAWRVVKLVRIVRLGKLLFAKQPGADPLSNNRSGRQTSTSIGERSTPSRLRNQQEPWIWRNLPRGTNDRHVCGETLGADPHAQADELLSQQQHHRGHRDSAARQRGWKWLDHCRNVLFLGAKSPICSSYPSNDAKDCLLSARTPVSHQAR